MKLVRFLIALVPLAFCACATFDKTTGKTLDEALAICKRDIHNEPLAQKTCFPMISGKELVARLEKIASYSDHARLTLNVGSDNIIYCDTSAADFKEISEHPEKMKIGELYSIKGRFSELSTASYGNWFTLKDCSFKHLADMPPQPQNAANWNTKP